MAPHDKQSIVFAVRRNSLPVPLVMAGGTLDTVSDPGLHCIHEELQLPRSANCNDRPGALAGSGCRDLATGTTVRAQREEAVNANLAE